MTADLSIVEETSFATECAEEQRDEAFDRMLKYFSGWNQLKKACCVFVRFFSFLKWKKENIGFQVPFPDQSSLFTVEAMQQAESAILKYLQQTAFTSEMQQLKTNELVDKQSSIRRLNPFIQDSLLRVGGRIHQSQQSDDAKHPIIIPKNCHITTLIIRHCHVELGHAGRNHVLSQLREKYWVINANSQVRKVIWNCVDCRRRKRSPEHQLMAELPKERLSTDPPFTHTGADLFGPFTVKNGRKECKRYGVILTCLQCRAVHVEVASSLETDSFINALRRFIARRGQVKSIFCDNGTNIIGAEKELH
jgi:hypothetical protein